MEDFSAVILARNEAITLPRLLKSLEGVTDIVVLDTGSTDGTADVARSLGCNIIEVGGEFRIEATEEQVMWWKHHHGWEPSFKARQGYFHFANARNYAASFAENDWVFQPDADEIMTWDLDKVRKAIQNEDHLTYRFCYAHNQPDPECSDWSCGLELLQSKFYRRSKFRWQKWVHEVLQPIPGQNPKPPLWCEFIYHHHWQRGKGERETQYLAGLELSVSENPADDRNVYYLAREYFYHARYDEAIQFFEKALELGKWPPERSQAFVYKSNCHQAKGEIGKAVDCLHRAMMETDSRREPFWELALLYEAQGQVERALVYLHAALAIPFTPQGYLNKMELYGWKIPDKLAFLHDKQGDREEAKKYWLMALEHDPPPVILQNGVSYFYQEQPLISIVVPTVRPDGYKRLVRSIEASTVYPDYELVKMSGEGSAIEKFNAGVEEARGELIVYVADDCEANPGWLTQAFVCFKENFRGKGLVILSDDYWQGRMANHFLCSKNLRDELGGSIWHPGYHHWGVDNELHGRLKQKNLIEFCPNAKIIHHHPDTPTRGTLAGKRDKFYNSIIPHIEADRELLRSRQKELDFEVMW